MKLAVRTGIFFAITFVLTILLALVQQTLGIETAMISLPQFGPGLAAVTMLLAFRRDNMEVTIAFRGIPRRKFVAALAIPLLVPGIIFLVYDQIVAPLTIPPIDASGLALLLGGILLGAFGEELGWRGYAQKLLDRERSESFAFLVVGILWGVWHIGNFQYGPAYMFFFVLSTIGYSAVLAWLLRGTRYNVVLATLFHFGVNVGFYILQGARDDLRLVALNGLVWLGGALLVAARRRRKLAPAG